MITTIGGVAFGNNGQLEFKLVQQQNEEHIQMEVDGVPVTLNLAQVQQLKLIMARCTNALQAAGESRLHRANLGLFDASA